MAKTDMT